MVRSEPLLFAMVPLAALGYALYSVWEHNHFLTDFDLAIFDQAVWNYSQFQTPTITTIDPPVNMLGDHFSPLLILISPLYWIWSDPRMLLIAQGVLVAASIVPVFLYSRPRLGRVGAYLLCVGYTVFWGVGAAIGFQFHELAFTPLLVALCILFADRRQWGAFFVSVGLLLMVKENMSVLVVFIGLWLISGREFKFGAITVAAGAIAYFLILHVMIPAFSGEEYTHWTYTDLGPDAGSALQTSLTRPDVPLGLLVDDSTKRLTLALLFLPFLGLTLCSRLAILCIPLVGQQLLSDFPQYWSTEFHHWLPIVPVLAMGAADGFRNLTSRIGSMDERRVAIAGAVVGAVIVAANLTIVARERLAGEGYDYQLTGIPLFAAIRSDFSLSQTSTDVSKQRILDGIPDDATATVAAPLLPHLSQRREIYMLGHESPRTEFIAFSPDFLLFPDPSYAQQWLDRNRIHYRVVDFDGSWRLWKRLE